MARQDVEVDLVIFDPLRSILQEPKGVDGEPFANVLAARAYLNLALASTTFPDVEAWNVTKDHKCYIMVQPLGDDGLDFYVDVFDGSAAHIYVRLQDFDASRPEERQTFRMYRALVDAFRQLPVFPEHEATIIVGPFEVFCSEEEDALRWNTIWERWEHAYGE